MKHLKGYKLFESNNGYTMYSGITNDKWLEIWKDKKLKDRLTNVTSDYDFALDYSYNFKTGQYEDLVIEISNIPLEAFVAYRDEDYNDDDDFNDMTMLDDNVKSSIIKSNSLFLVNLYLFKDEVSIRLI